MIDIADPTYEIKKWKWPKKETVFHAKEIDPEHFEMGMAFSYRKNTL